MLLSKILQNKYDAKETCTFDQVPTVLYKVLYGEAPPQGPTPFVYHFDFHIPLIENVIRLNNQHLLHNSGSQRANN